jgi:predicted anti-sigma-YlaC factor YlaD
MKCKEAHPLLNDYLEGSLSSDDKARVEQHLSECESCRHDLREIKITFDLLALDCVPEPEERFWINFLPEVRSRIEERRKPIKTLVPKTRLVLGFLSILLVAIISLQLFHTDQRNLAQMKSNQNTETVVTDPNLFTAADQLAEVLSAPAMPSTAIGVILSPEEIQNLDSTGILLTDDYLNQSDLNTMLSELSSDELKQLEESMNQIKLSKTL